MTVLRRETPFLRPLHWPNNLIAAFLKRFFFLQVFTNMVSMSVQRSLAAPHVAPIQVYLVMKQCIPLLAFGALCIGYRLHPWLRRGVNSVVAAGVVAAFAFQLASGSSWNAPIFGWYWQYHALYLYAALFFIGQLLLRRHGFAPHISLYVSLIAAQLVGALYEVPIYPRMCPYVGIWAHHWLPFYINGVWLLLPGLAIWLLRNVRWKLRPWHFTFGMVWLACSVLYGLQPFSFPAYLPRLPTALFAMLLVSEVRPQTLFTTGGGKIEVGG